MRKSFNFNDPQFIVRVVLGVLLAANLVAVGLVLFPPGGSAEELEQQVATLQSQVRPREAAVAHLRDHAAAVDKGRSEGDQFLGDYFLSGRTAFSTLVGELQNAASQSKIKAMDHAYSTEPVEGSDTMSLLSITAAYTGTYADLMHFVHELDRSHSLLIIESLSAAPQQNSDILTVSMKLDTFVRESAPQP
jgi:Tfp pilus assembly protein PilO